MSSIFYISAHLISIGKRIIIRLSKAELIVKQEGMLICISMAETGISKSSY
jgi:hypothetical protein